MPRKGKKGGGAGAKVPRLYAIMDTERVRNGKVTHPGTKSKKKKKRTKGPRGPKSSFTIGPPIVRGVCSITDPFCPAARGAKWPDGTLGNTMTEQFHGVTTITTDVNGNAGFVLNPFPPYGYIKSAAFNTTTVTFDAAYTILNSNSMLATNGYQMRVVSAGCIVRVISTMANSQGTYTCGSSTVPTLSGNYVLNNMNYMDCMVKSIAPGTEIAWISAPQGTVARDFGSQGVTSGPTLNECWSSLYVEVSGAVATVNVLSVEYFVNVEFTILKNNAMAKVTRPNPPQITDATAASSAASSTLGQFFDGGVKYVETAVYNAASGALDQFLSHPFENIAMLLSSA